MRDGGDEEGNARLQFRPIRARQRCVGGVIPLSPSPSLSLFPLPSFFKHNTLSFGSRSFWSSAAKAECQCFYNSFKIVIVIVPKQLFLLSFFYSTVKFEFDRSNRWKINALVFQVYVTSFE